MVLTGVVAVILAGSRTVTSTAAAIGAPVFVVFASTLVHRAGADSPFTLSAMLRGAAKRKVRTFVD